MGAHFGAILTTAHLLCLSNMRFARAISYLIVCNLIVVFNFHLLVTVASIETMVLCHVSVSFADGTCQLKTADNVFGVDNDSMPNAVWYFI